ncbi:MAG: bifunctional pyr operon transcriptional regulator/uracil phosphoribosyltransferase PyrR [Saprospiraceae bacterium]
MKKESRTVLSHPRFELTIDRLCHQLLENHHDFSNACLISIQPRGTLFAERIYQRLAELTDLSGVSKGKLDVTFYRDDFRKGKAPLIPNKNEMNFLIEDKDVILIDDVLYTGRTIRAALTALQHYGRPKSVELLVLVDRRFNRHLPIQPDYVGLTIDSVDEAHIKVDWAETQEEDKILLYSRKEDI